MKWRSQSRVGNNVFKFNSTQNVEQFKENAFTSLINQSMSVEKQKLIAFYNSAWSQKELLKKLDKSRLFFIIVMFDANKNKNLNILL